MNAEEIGKLIRNIRKENNLTQKEFAKRYNVTYQAVSNWEHGKNIPDIALLKDICKDYNLSLEELLNGDSKTVRKKTFLKKNFSLLGIIIILIILGIVVVAYIFPKEENNFEFKTLSSSCELFNITGSISYNNKKTAIYISDIDYCGEPDETLYTSVECILYESYENTETKISIYNVESDNGMTIDEFLKDVYFVIEDYVQNCDEYSDKSLYIKVDATTEEEKTISYSIPLNLVDVCEVE